MGRGRSKAKQTKVARELKYSSHGIDLERLRKESAVTIPRQTARSTILPPGGLMKDNPARENHGSVAPRAVICR